jgi:hypothetical protein
MLSFKFDGRLFVYDHFHLPAIHRGDRLPSFPRTPAGNEESSQLDPRLFIQSSWHGVRYPITLGLGPPTAPPRRLGKLATAQSQTLSEVYAFARHCCLWRHQ